MARAAAPFSEVSSAVRTWSGPSWLTDARKAAIERFDRGGLPTTRDESWRTTPLPDLGARAFFPGFASTANRASGVVRPFLDGHAPTITFVDGFHCVTLSSSEETWPKGLRLAPVSQLLAMKPDDLKPWFSGPAETAGALHDLNSAAFRDGAAIVVEDAVAAPIDLRLVIVATSAEQPVAQHMRNLVHVGRDSHLRLTIAVIGPPDALGFVNNHTTISLADGAHLGLVRLHQSPVNVPHFDALTATLGAHSVLTDTLLQTGSAWTRSEIDVALVGERAFADLGGVFAARGTQVSDIHTLVSHQALGVVSRQNYRGLAADEARGVFHGQIRVEPEARGADATQTNKNMLLSRRAHVHSTPALEILTDDVKCKHGSATGQIDQAQLFYLRSRGLGIEEATRILTRAFASEILSRIDDAATRGLAESRTAPDLDHLGVAS